MRRLSLRARLLLICVALLAVGFTISGVVVAEVLRGHLVKRVDSQLTQLTAILGGVSPGAIPGFDPTVLPAELGARLDLIGEIEIVYLRPDGGVERVMHSAGSGGPALPRLDAAGVAARDGRPFGVADVDGGAGWRVVALPRSAAPLLGEPPPTGASVAVAASTSTVDGTVARLRAVCLLTGVGLVAVLAVAGWFAIRAGLRPLRRIEQTAAAIAGGDLSQRVPDEAASGTEIGRLSAALNGMLGQVETAFAAREASEARMRRFVADVSHELRTPLSGIKGFTELYRMGGVTGEAEVARTMARIESESKRLAQLTEDLLLLARLDEGDAGLPLHRAPMDLRTLAADARRDLTALDPTRTVTVTGPGGQGPAAPAPVDGDEARLRQVVANLVGNAVAHTPAGTPVRIGVGVEGGAAILEVADRGPGLAPEEADRVFERFYRAGESRTRAAGAGAGLGLAIVASLVAAHTGTVTATPTPGGGTTFRVALPVLPRTPAPPGS
ncbi:HAMP domain-containing sensor histidine kinase [Phytohabitans sp. ZYX-F-186]|uniref:histidine kinase n=1 Tax=Phytohabitans maris TaxID=3071409 RepID=A0ABU0ZMD8_9ACTN|nr:HAMP domain-containing sensor histidine kinase [Phytohabitans sp. ZYX-F-186]MDQ7908194.1 HAMP domain-containing sensor histidine kinase [Phytohabitans sp. ZYX-F-186]